MCFCWYSKHAAYCFPALHANAIDHCQLASNWPVVLHVMFHFIFFEWLPCVIYNHSFCRSASSHVAAYMPSIDVPTIIFTKVLMPCTFMFMPVIPGPCFLYGCFGTASPLCTGLGMVCVQCVPCISECTAWCTAIDRTTWPHPCWLLYLMAYDQWWHILL